MELTKAKEELKFWFLEFIRGNHDPTELKAPEYYSYDRLQENYNAADVRFKMYEGASQEHYMKVQLPGFVDEDGREVGFTDDDMLEAIFYNSHVYDVTDPFGYSVRDDGLTGMITFERDKVKSRRELNEN